MNIETAELLRRINNDFYRKHCDSFSSSRHAPWAGWKQCFAAVREARPEIFGVDDGLCSGGSTAQLDPGAPAAGCSAVASGTSARADDMRASLSVLDVACGNLRFETFCAEALSEVDLAFYAIDNCDSLAAEALSSCARPVRYQSFDVLESLARGVDLADAWEAPACDLVVSFGFMHHVPLLEQREALLAALVSKARPGGQVAVSFWQFLNSPDLAEKANATHERAVAELGLPTLDEGDFMLGWMNAPGEYRYCHNFSEAEIDALAASVAGKARVAARFSADGRTQNLNSYLVLQVI